MKFAVTAVPISRETRRRVGKARTEVVDTEKNKLFRYEDRISHYEGPMTEPLQVEQKYESFWNDLNPQSPHIVKVIDVREVQ